MASPASELERADRRRAPAIALLHGERIVAVNPPLMELCGYTRGELTSPEFRLAHIFRPGSPPLAIPPRAQATTRDEAVLDPLRGPPVDCARTLWRLDEREPPALVMLLEHASAARAEALPGGAEMEAAREVVRAASAHLADMLGRLRRAQLRIESLEHAHPEVLVHELRDVGGFVERLQHLEETVEALARATGARG